MPGYRDVERYVLFMAVVYSNERFKKFMEVAMAEMNWEDVLRSFGINEFRDLGERYELKCPFHDDWTPSFNASLTRKVYHCFSCGRKGTIIKFMYLMSDSSLSFSAYCENMLKSNIMLQDRCGFSTLKITTDEIQSKFEGRRMFNKSAVLSSDMSLYDLYRHVSKCGRTWNNLAMSLTLLQEGIPAKDVCVAVESIGGAVRSIIENVAGDVESDIMKGAVGNVVEGVSILDILNEDDE